jgi:hypothetical protein
LNDQSQPVAPQGLQGAPASLAPDAASASDLQADELRGRDLRGQDLTEIDGLLPEHLAGADLTGAKLPEEIAKFPALEQVKAISAEARKIFIGLLAACVYSWLVIGKTHDIELILNTAGSPLPIINTAMPIAGFYVLGAAILAALYCYLHFYLQRLWRTLATLPAIFPDGVVLDDKSDPWLLTNLVRTEFTLLRPSAPPLARLENLLAVFLTCGSYRSPSLYCGHAICRLTVGSARAGWAFCSSSRRCLGGTRTGSHAPRCRASGHVAKPSRGISIGAFLPALGRSFAGCMSPILCCPWP